MSASQDVKKIGVNFSASQTDTHGPYVNSGPLAEILVLSADGAQVLVSENANAIQETLAPIALQLGVDEAKSGEIDFRGDDVFSGGTTLFGGVVGIGASHSLGSGALTFADNATLLAKANVRFSNAVNIDANVNATFAADAGFTLTLAPSAWTVDATLNSVLTFGAAGHSGVVALQAATALPLASDDSVVVAAGTLKLASGSIATPFGGAGRVTVQAGATLDLDGANLSLHGLGGGGVVSNSAAGTVSTLQFASASNADPVSDFAGSILDGNGTVALDVNGGGARALLMLTGANHFSGGTTVEADQSLVLGDTLHAASLTGTVTIQGANGHPFGGIFSINANATFSGDVRFAGPGAQLLATEQAGLVANGDDGGVFLRSSTISISGGNETVEFEYGVNHAHLSNTGGRWDNVTGSNGVIEATHAQVNVSDGGDNTINLDGTDSEVSVYGGSDRWDTVNASGSQINVTAAQVRVVGGGDRITATPYSWLELHTTGAAADVVTASGAEIDLYAASASVTGGDDVIVATAGSSLSLAGTGDLYDTVYASGAAIDVIAAQASIHGSGDTISATAGSRLDLSATWYSADVVVASGISISLQYAQASIAGGGDAIAATAGSSLSLSGTNGQGDTITGSQDHIAMTAAQASISGGGNVIEATSGSSISLYLTAGAADTVFASGDRIDVTASQASILGGGDTIHATAGSAISLFKTDGTWDTVHATNAEIDLTGAQASILGGGNVIDASFGSQVGLSATAGVWDTVHGDFELITLNSAQASIFGGGNVIDGSAASLMSLYGTNGVVDQVSGSQLSLILNDADASLKGSDDTVFLYGANALSLHGSHETLTFGPALGLDTISGFNTSDTLRLSAADWSSFLALQASGALQQHGADTILTTGAGNTLTLAHTAAASLTAAQFAFV